MKYGEKNPFEGQYDKIFGKLEYEHIKDKLKGPGLKNQDLKNQNIQKLVQQALGKIHDKPGAINMPLDRHRLKPLPPNPPIHHEHVDASDVQNDVRKYLQEKLPDAVHDKVARIHDQVVDESKTLNKQAVLAANIFGCEQFEGKKLQDSGADIEGPGSEHAIFSFMEDLATFCAHLEQTGDTETLQHVREIQEEYKILYMSALLRKAIKTERDPAVKKELQKVAADLFKKDIQDVQDGRKPRSAWLGGSADHFVPIRYERDSATGLLRMGAFNLGGGSNQLQLADASGRKIQAEARLGVVVETSNGPAILCSESFLNNSLDSICRNVVDIAANKGLANWVEFLNGKAPKHSNNPDLVQSYRDYLPNDINQTVLYQAKQKMGDCTCRGQWALLKKEFDRLGIGPQFKQYKNLVEEQKIQRLPQAKVMELANDHKSTFLRPEDVHQICWADHNRLSPDAQKRLKETPRKRGEEWKARIINIPMAHVKEGSIPMSLEALFQGHTKVIIGRQPAQAGVAKGVAYYAISPSDSSVSREHIELSIDSKGGVKGKVLGQNGIWVTYNNGEKRLYTKDQTFEITESVRCIDTEKNPKAHLFQFS